MNSVVVGGGDGDADANPEGNASGGDDVHGSGSSPVSDTLDIDGAIEQAHEQDVGPEVLKILILTKQERERGIFRAPRSHSLL